MHENTTILFISIVIIVYGYFSKYLFHRNISAPMVFTTLGVLLSPLFFGSDSIDINGDLIQTIAEITLVIVLFGDASALDLQNLKREWQLPARLLAIGLPITIILSTYIATLFFPDQPTIIVLLMALILAPTDAALGKAVVSDKRVPEKIRSTINVESGLNDGIVFPLLITVVAIINSNQPQGTSDGWFLYVLQQISIGAIAGAFVGYSSAILATKAIDRDWIEEDYVNLIPIALAIFSYYFAEHFGGNGFISAFFSGLFLGNNSEKLRENVKNFANSEGEFLIMICFLVFGIAFIPVVVEYWSLKAVIYSLLSLTLFRILPIWISLMGTRLDSYSKLFMAWFGPRGIASILYVLIVIHDLSKDKDLNTIYGVISLTILLSIFLHGLTAIPLSKLYKR